MALKKLCRCGKVIEDRTQRCEKCEADYQAYKANHAKQYDKQVRRSSGNKPFDAFYKTQKWLTLRMYTKDWYNNIDVYEYYTTGKIIKAETVHHIIELKDDFGQCYKFDNLIPMSLKNHSKIHLLYKWNKSKYQKELLSMLERFKDDFK